MRVIIFVFIFFNFLNSPINASQFTENDRKSVERTRTITPHEICNAVVTGMSKKQIVCNGNSYDKDRIHVSVTKSLRSEFVEFDVQLMAKSELLSGYVGKNGYESHKLKLLFFLGYNFKNSIWVYLYEPRYNRADYKVAQNINNPNWKLYSDVDRQQTLLDNFQAWVVSAFIKK